MILLEETNPNCYLLVRSLIKLLHLHLHHHKTSSSFSSCQQVRPGQPTQLLQVLAEGEGGGTGTELGVGAGVGKAGALPTPPLASSTSPAPAPTAATVWGGYWYAEPAPREWSTVQERSADGSGWEVRQQQQPARVETPANQMPPAVYRPVNWRDADG